MYVVDPAVKADPVRRWALPDRVFFACGACHVLAHVALERYAPAGFSAKWLRPPGGRIGNHIVVSDGGLAFDYHGWAPLADSSAMRSVRRADGGRTGPASCSTSPRRPWSRSPGPRRWACTSASPTSSCTIPCHAPEPS